MSLLKWFLDTTNNRLIKGERNGEVFEPPPFFQGDLVPLELVLLEANPSGGYGNPYTVIGEGAYTVKVALTSPDPDAGTAEVFSSVTLVFDGVRAWTGDLPLNTSEIDDLLGASKQATCKLEIEITTGTGVISTELMLEVTVLADGIKTGIPDAIPDETFVTSSQFANEAMKKKGEPGQGYILVSDDGLKGLERRLIKDPDTGEYKVKETWINYPPPP